jgi:hypothetical protein
LNEEKKLPEEEIKPEKTESASTPDSAANPEEKNQAQKRGRRFLTFYIIALFSIALVLIGISYMSQVKADRLNSQLTEQTTAAQGAKAKVEELQTLVTDQQKTIEEYNELFGVEKGKTATDARKALDEKNDALNYLWQLEKNYQKDEWESCQQILQKMQTAYGDQLEDRENGVLTGAAWDEYQLIQKAVTKHNEGN